MVSVDGFCHENAARDLFWIRHVGAALRRFRYLRDGLFLAAATCYGLNRWLLKPLVAWPFLRGQFNDLLLIPAALPVVLWVQRKTGLRNDDEAPTWSEITLHLGVWSVICEGMVQSGSHRGTSDLWDVVAYGVGGVAAGIWWNHRPWAKPKTIG